MGPEPWFTQEAYKIPALLTKEQLLASEKLAKTAVHALGFDNCGFHCEQKVTNDGPVLLETAARLPGGCIPTCYERATGTNPLSNLVDLWLGRKIAMPPVSYKKHVIERPMYPLKKGTLTKLKVLESTKNMEGLWLFKVNEEIGNIVTTYPEVPKAIYTYGLEAANDQELQNKITKLESQVDLLIQ